MEEYDFVLEDRIAKIQAINEQLDLLNNSSISWSGGVDSQANSRLIDIALPGNNIPRVFVNTGVEYNEMLKFVKEQAKKDKRIGAKGPIFLKFSMKLIQKDISVSNVYHSNSVSIELYLNS